MTQQSERDLRNLLSQAQKALAAGRLPEAEEQLARAGKIAPKLPYRLYLLGLLRHQQRRHGDALTHFREAMPHLQSDPIALFNYATVLVCRFRTEVQRPCGMRF